MAAQHTGQDRGAPDQPWQHLAQPGTIRRRDGQQRRGPHHCLGLGLGPRLEATAAISSATGLTGSSSSYS
ncbi:MAG TPA: hypothetical protein VHH34_07585, partial [Pseudonocardiaceae bacterium]|nr:hypothetical protein [Pseudonocardiaceae bacterium]